MGQKLAATPAANAQAEESAPSASLRRSQATKAVPSGAGRQGGMTPGCPAHAVAAHGPTHMASAARRTSPRRAPPPGSWEHQRNDDEGDRDVDPYSTGPGHPPARTGDKAAVTPLKIPNALARSYLRGKAAPNAIASGITSRADPYTARRVSQPTRRRAQAAGTATAGRGGGHAGPAVSGGRRTTGEVRL